jgi:hypothetical protein
VNPRAEARERLGGRYEVLVLEPSPPAVDDPPWFADDPTDHAAASPGGHQLVSPVTNTDMTWNQLCDADPDLSEWCAERWLGSWRRLEELPAEFAETRGALHAVAEHVMAPARHQANGKIGLRYTRRGFGTPFFANDVQVRVEGYDLVVQRGDCEDRSPIVSVAQAATAVDITPGAPAGVFRPSTSPDMEQELVIDEGAALSLGAWFGFGASVLEQLRWDLHWAAPSRLQLWPEHFDLSIELGHENSGSRAGYGASPGDEQHPMPYLYVAPWSQELEGPNWNDDHFFGASLSYEELLEAADQRATALAFFHRCCPI